jgi:hypothetical protein
VGVDFAERRKKDLRFIETAPLFHLVIIIGAFQMYDKRKISKSLLTVYPRWQGLDYNTIHVELEGSYV